MYRGLCLEGPQINAGFSGHPLTFTSVHDVRATLSTGQAASWWVLHWMHWCQTLRFVRLHSFYSCLCWILLLKALCHCFCTFTNHITIMFCHDASWYYCISDQLMTHTFTFLCDHLTTVKFKHQFIVLIILMGGAVRTFSMVRQRRQKSSVLNKHEWQ